jgi:hypothetical protein
MIFPQLFELWCRLRRTGRSLDQLQLIITMIIGWLPERAVSRSAELFLQALSKPLFLHHYA